MMLARMSVLLVAAVSPLGAWAAGNLSYGQVGGEAQQMMEYGHDAVRMSQRGQAQWMLYKDKEQTLYVIDDSKKSYQKVTKEMAQQLGKQVDAMKSQIEAQMAMLPPEQREMMRGMMPKIPDIAQQHNYRVENDGKAREVASYACQPILVYDNDEPSEALCIASLKDLKVTSQDFALLKRMGETMSSFAAQFGAGSMAAVMDKIDGIPVEHRKAGSETAQSVLLRVGQEEPKPERMSVPKGYAEQSLMQGFGQ
ncbi:MAG: hypothetical protein ACSHXK_03060 [Oceanococcus sp.]